MNLTLLFLALSLMAGLVMLVLHIRRASDGYEDDTGFHVGKKPQASVPYYDAFMERQREPRSLLQPGKIERRRPEAA